MKFDSYANQMLEKGLDGMWLKMRIATNNIANYETPGYKAEKIEFAQVLRECDSPLHGGERDTSRYRAYITKDELTEARVDGNNVSMENEQLELWRAQAQYAYLTQKYTNHFNRMRTVMKEFAK